MDGWKDGRMEHPINQTSYRITPCVKVSKQLSNLFTIHYKMSIFDGALHEAVIDGNIGKVKELLGACHSGCFDKSDVDDENSDGRTTSWQQRGEMERVAEHLALFSNSFGLAT
jgi:hypothetical protein